MIRKYIINKQIWCESLINHQEYNIKYLITKKQGSTEESFFVLKFVLSIKIWHFFKSADLYCEKMSFQSQIYQKMTKLKPNHKTQN